MSVGYTLFPRLRAAKDVPERRRLVANEARLVSAVVLVGSVAIWVVTPAIERWFLAGKYHLAGSLVLAVVVSGIAKVFNAFTRATASALATTAELSAVNLLGWVSVVVGLLAAIVGARDLGSSLRHPRRSGVGGVEGHERAAGAPRRRIGGMVADSGAVAGHAWLPGRRRGSA
jgi:hypothetical protein